MRLFILFLLAAMSLLVRYILPFLIPVHSSPIY